MNVLPCRTAALRSLRRACLQAGLAATLWSLAVGALAQTNPPSAADVAAAQASGTSIAQGYRSGLPAMDAKGNVLQNSNGQLSSGTSSSTQAAGSTALMQSITGVSGYQTSGNPGASSPVFAGTTTNSGTIDFPCAASPGSVRAAGGVSVAFQGCNLQNGKIASLQVQVCTALGSGSFCGPADYSAPMTLVNGQYTTISNGTIGVGCSDAIRTCRLSLTMHNAMNVSAANLTQQAAASNNAPELRSSLTNLVQSQTYADQMTKQQAIADCYSTNQASFNAGGAVSTCSGNQSANVTAGSAGGSCTQTTTCVKPTSSTTSYNTTCTRNFPITTYSCPSTIPTRDCTVQIDERDSFTKTSSCSATDTAGGTLVGTTNQGCTQYGELEPGVHGCLQTTHIEHYVFPAKSVPGTCSASPLPIDGPFNQSVCAMAQQDRVFSCDLDGWYGRTLTDQECQTSTVNGGAQTTFTQWDYRAKAGCGYCIKNELQYTCRGKSTANTPGNSCAAANLSGCTLTNVAVQSAVYGITLSQQETYSCSTSTAGCAQWQTTSNCLNVATTGSPTPPTTTTPGDNGAFNQMLAAGAVAEGVSASGRDQSLNPGSLSIFPGADERCRKPLGFIDKVVSNDCCATGLTRPGGGRPLTSCTKAEVDLAAARRSNFEVYIGNYCSKQINFVFFTTCVEQTQTYCVFKGVLPRIIQVQGRQQLQAIAPRRCRPTPPRRRARRPSGSGSPPAKSRRAAARCPTIRRPVPVRGQ